MMRRCRLLGNKGALCESHLIPSFAIQYMKATGSKFLRSSSTPNMRLQDGIKIPLLSFEAEQIFASREKWFAEHIFLPYMEEGKKEFVYDERLYFFSLSFLWRVLVLHLDFTQNFERFEGYEKLVEVEKEWRQFLSESILLSNFPSVQILLTDRIAHTSVNVNGLDYYTSRACDMTVISTPNMNYLAVYGKFLRFVFWSVISIDISTDYSQTTINPIGGTLSVPQELIDDYLFDFFINRSNHMFQLPGPTEKQQLKIKDEIERSKKSFLDSDAGHSILNDYFRNYQNGF